jgi:hypothetical protein
VKKETRHFYFIIGIILLIMGGFSFVYGSLIPTKFFTINEIPSLFFQVLGVVFFISGIGLLLYLRTKKVTSAQKEPINP